MKECVYCLKSISNSNSNSNDDYDQLDNSIKVICSDFFKLIRKENAIKDDEENA